MAKFRPGRRGGKKLSDQAVIGETGINLIERIVHSMKCAWNPTNQRTEVGIDGEIELVDPATREATGVVIRVQSRATVLPFTAETEDTFEYLCDERDLEYWLKGNARVILVVSRPHTDEAYWVSVKNYFENAVVKKERRVHFDKRSMRFSADSLPQLLELAAPAAHGVYFTPVPRQETLYANLLRVVRLPERLWLAETGLRARSDVFERLRANGADAPEYVLGNKRLLSAHDLTEWAWRDVVDRGTVEQFAADEWEASADAEKRKSYVELLNRCLTARAHQIGAIRRRDDDALFFTASKDLSPKKVPFQSVKLTSERTVFQAYMYKAPNRAGEVACFRHAACFVQFYRFQSQWYLGIVPTYHYTSDGYRKHPLSAEYLSGMKRQERQGAVLYQVVMWASLLRGGKDGDAERLPSGEYPFLGFGALQTLALSVGIDDKAWLPSEDEETAEAGEQTLGDLPLFSAIPATEGPSK